MCSVLQLGTLIRPVSKFTSDHFSISTSDGHRSPANRDRATMVRHVGLAAPMSRSASAVVTYAFRSDGSTGMAFTSANGFDASTFRSTAWAKIDRTRRTRRATVAAAGARPRKWSRN